MKDGRTEGRKAGRREGMSDGEKGRRSERGTKGRKSQGETSKLLISGCSQNAAGSDMDAYRSQYNIGVK